MMKIKNVKIDLNTSYANSPRIEVYIDELPEVGLFIQKDRLYFSENDGYVRFLADSDNHNGYGGSKFELKMLDGTVKTLRGPWSSRSGVMNAMGFTPCVDVVYIDKDDYHYSGSITVEKLQKVLGEKATLVPTENFGDIVYEVKV